MKEKIIAALQQMDAANDEQWTKDGAPRLEVVAKLMEVEAVTRKEVTEAAPLFSRENMQVEADPEVKPDETKEETADNGEQAAPAAAEVTSSTDPVEAAAEALEAAELAFNEAKKNLEAARKAHDEALTLRDQINPPKSAAEVIAEFQRSQQEQRAMRAGGLVKIEQLLGTSTNVKPMDPVDLARQNMPKSGPVRGTTVKV